MAIVKNIGKNTLGDNDKMSVALHDYEMSNHNLSFVFRNTQSPGTLVPCMKIVAQKGDVFDIEMYNKTLTHPTVGPLFGSYKLQHFIFSCPIRLYNSWLHNNRLGIGMNMKQIKLPVMAYSVTSEGSFKTSSSSLLNYMGFKGYTKKGSGTFNFSINALPLLMYGDIFKNYFANKQEKEFYYITIPDNVKKLEYDTGESGFVEWTIGIPQTRMKITNSSSIKITVEDGVDAEQIWNGISIQTTKGTYPLTKLTTSSLTGNIITLGKTEEIIGNSTTEVIKFVYNDNAKGVKLKSGKLDIFDEIRDKILANPGNIAYDIRIQSQTNGNYFYDIWKSKSANQAGLIVKTYDSDIFQNWVNTEWIDGDNGINEITAVDVSDGKLTMDSLNLAQKVYNMLNRIAISGGTYRDWLETVYTSGTYIERPETPVFEGGMSQYIEFDEVVSQSATEDEPLGTLAGRGKNTEQLGSGKLHFKVSEPSYIIGLCAITPQIDYSQGNDWDMLSIKTLDDFHKPALDGIGYQDSINGERAWWTSVLTGNDKWTNTAAGKTVAWINYMTNFNKTFGNFAADESESFMCLNRNYEMNDNDNTIEDLTTYIDPSKHNEIFADTNIDAMNFWVQTAFKIQVRRNISAKQIPNL